jgi:chromate transporter
MVQGTILDVPTLAIAVLSGILLFKYRINTTWLIAGGALAGILFYALGVRGLMGFW